MYIGPYRILRKYSPTNLEVEEIGSGLGTRRIHINKAVPYVKDRILYPGPAQRAVKSPDMEMEGARPSHGKQMWNPSTAMLDLSNFSHEAFPFTIPLPFGGNIS